MDIRSTRKRINAAVKKLNQMNHNLRFLFKEEEHTISLECHSTVNEGSRFGAYEAIEFFDDYRKKSQAYISLMEYAEVIIAAAGLNDPKAYHNFIAG